MIIWSGFGFLAALIPFAFFLLAEVLTHGSGAKHNWTGSIALLLSAIVIWVLGNKLNNAPGKDLIDPQTGQTVRLRRTHSLFFIPMQYIAVLAVIVALIVLVAPVVQP